MICPQNINRKEMQAKTNNIRVLFWLLLQIPVNRLTPKKLIAWTKKQHQSQRLRIVDMGKKWLLKPPPNSHQPQKYSNRGNQFNILEHRCSNIITGNLKNTFIRKKHKQHITVTAAPIPIGIKCIALKSDRMRLRFSPHHWRPDCKRISPVSSYLQRREWTRRL